VVKPILPFPPTQGTRRVTLSLLRALGADHEVTLVAPLLAPGDAGPARRLEELTGCRVLSRPAPNRRSNLHRVWYKAAYLLQSFAGGHSPRALYAAPPRLLEAAAEFTGREPADLAIFEYWYSYRYFPHVRARRRVLLAHDAEFAVNRLAAEGAERSTDRVGRRFWAGREARRRNIPVVFDPVGCGATQYRTAVAQRIILEVHPTIIRGNASEIRSLIRSGPGARGVDSVHTPEAIREEAQRLSMSLGCVVSVSGEVDLVGVDALQRLSWAVEVKWSDRFVDRPTQPGNRRPSSCSVKPGAQYELDAPGGLQRHSPGFLRRRARRDNDPRAVPRADGPGIGPGHAPVLQQLPRHAVFARRAPDGATRSCSARCAAAGFHESRLGRWP